MWLLTSVVLLIAAYSLVGLVAVWGALGRGHWFWRIVAVQLFLAPWLAAPNDRFWVAFFVQSATVIGVLLVIRLWRRTQSSPDAVPQCGAAGPPPPTFSLKDLFLLTLALAGVLMVLARVWSSMQSQWLSAIAPGAAFAVFTLMAVATANVRRLWARLALLVFFFPGAVMAIWLWLARSARGRIGQAAAVAGLLFIAAPPAAFYAWLVEPQFINLPEPPADNGMDDLLRAAEMVVAPAVDVNALSGDALKTYLDGHQLTLELARAGLARPCQIDLASHGTGLTRTDFDRTSNLRQLGRVLAAAGRNHSASGDHRGAVDDYLQVVELGAATMHGGAMLHANVGLAIQGAGFECLAQLLPQLDAAACQELDARLDELEARQESLDEIVSREWQFVKKTSHWYVRWHVLQVPLLWEQPRQAFELGFQRGLARRRLFRTHLALRRFRLAEREYPETLEKLTPRYLAELPLDPFSGRALIYRRLPDGYQLYSVGENRIDDGGAPATPATAAKPAAGDLLLDVPQAPDEGVGQKFNSP